MNEENKKQILDTLYLVLDLIRNELGEGEVTEEIRKSIDLLD